jgi:hypothetical protein
VSTGQAGARARTVPPVALSCRVCRGFLAATSRIAVELFDETHTRDCGPAAVVAGGSLDDILNLPPYDIAL